MVLLFINYDIRLICIQICYHHSFDKTFEFFDLILHLYPNPNLLTHTLFEGLYPNLMLKSLLNSQCVTWISRHSGCFKTCRI